MKYRKLFALLLTTVFAFTLVLPPIFSEEDKDKDDDNNWGAIVEIENNAGKDKPTYTIGAENDRGDKLAITVTPGEEPGFEFKMSFDTMKDIASGIVDTVSGWFGGGSGSEECDTGCSCDPCSCGPDGESCSSGSCDD